MRLLLIVGIVIAAAVYYFLPSSHRNPATHVIAAIDYHNKSAATLNNSGTAISVILQSDWEVITNYNKKALAEAEQADIANMNRYYPGFGDHFRDEFIAGLKLIIDSDNSMQKMPAFLRGQMLESNFGDWYTANHDAMLHHK
jgi:hypothetical protein